MSRSVLLVGKTPPTMGKPPTCYKSLKNIHCIQLYTVIVHCDPPVVSKDTDSTVGCGVVMVRVFASNVVDPTDLIIDIGCFSARNAVSRSVVQRLVSDSESG